MLSLRKLAYIRGKRGESKKLTEATVTIDIENDMFSTPGNEIVLHINAHNTFEEIGYYMSMTREDASKLRDKLNALLD